VIVGPYESGRVYLGRAVDLMREIPDGSVAVIWTDPPFGNANQDGDLASARVGVRGARQAAAEPIAGDTPEEYEPLMRGFLEEARRVLRPDSCCCCCCGGGGPSPTFASLSQWMDEYLAFFHAVVWDKSDAGHGLGWRYRRNYEFVMVAHQRGGKLAWKEGAAPLPNILRVRPVRDRVHPNEKPVELIRLFLAAHASPGDLVLDPFAGSGSTGVAAEQLGLPFIGFDLDPKHVEASNVRLTQGRAVLKGHSAGQSALQFTDGGST
jgi:site-specific DNA-methyltransferase (adenine-specific)